MTRTYSLSTVRTSTAHLLMLIGALASLLAASPSALSQTIAQALNTTNLVWTTGGSAVWVTETNVTRDGLAVQSGPIGDNQESWLQTTVTAPGTLFFWWKVDSDWYTIYPDEVHADWFEFYVNGVLQDRIKGRPDWQLQTCYCGAPNSTLRWRYAKDGQYAYALDRGWLEQVSFTPDPMAPLWITQPLSRRMVEGSSVTFNAKAVGTLPLSYEWRFNNSPVDGATSTSLTLSNLTFAQTGDYSVSVTNSVNVLLSTNATLTVLPSVSLTNLGEWPGFERSQALCVALAGNYAYVGLRYWTSYGAFLVIDISNPARPLVLANVPIWADEPQQLFLRGNYVYIARGDGGLTIMDVTNPAAPVIAGTCATRYYAQGVYVRGDFAYVADSYSGLAIINVTNPQQPVLVGSCDLDGDAYGVMAVGNFAYVADGYGGFAVVAITNPAQPVLVATLPLNGASRLAVTGSTALVTTDDTGLVAIDVSDPYHPAYRGTNSIGYAIDISLAGNRAYVARDQNVDVFDVSNPLAPALLGTVGLPDWTEAIAVDNARAIVADWEAGLQILDISNPAQPADIGEYDTDGYAQGICLAGNFAFLADAQNGLQILDISDPYHPVRAGRCNTPGYSSKVHVTGNLACVADGSAGLQIVDWTDPAQPVLIGAYTNLPYASDVQVVGRYAYIASDDDGLSIIDISNPRQPQLVGGTMAVGRGDGVRVAGNFAYVVGPAGLNVVDVSNPSLPVRVGGVNTPDNAYDLCVVGHYVYLGADTAGVAIADVQDPAHPTIVGQCDTPSYAAGLQVLGGFAFLADWGDGLQVLDVTDPALPALVGGSPTPSDAFDARVAGHYAFVAQGEYGLGVKLLPGAFGPDPSITVSPASRAVVAGDPVTLAVTAEGSPPLSYRWFFNNTPLPGATNWVLCLDPVQPGQAGGYCVVASNISGVATSQVATLTIAAPLAILLSGTNAPGFDSDGTFNLSFSTEAATRYQVQYVNSLTQTVWNVLTNITGAGTPLRIKDSTPAPTQRFYRVRKL